MRRLALAALLWLINPVAHAQIARWDALPAVDVLHLQGPYAGSRVCPMCQHGYDAGLVVFLPATTPPAQARIVAQRLQSAARDIGDARFRPFVIVTGATPPAALLAALRGSDRNWFVAHLSPEALPGAARDFRFDLASAAHGYVFSQRRLLWSFDPLQPPERWAVALSRYAGYSLSFLRANHPRAMKSTSPDAPQGRLWAAPDRLSSSLRLGADSNARLKACLPQAKKQGARSLVAVMESNGSRRPAGWVVTDAAGCIFLLGTPRLAERQIEVHTPLRALRLGSVASEGQAGHATIRLAAGGVAGRPESDFRRVDVSRVRAQVTPVPVVGGPCEGCEAVFQGIPATLAPVSRIASRAEPGEPLTVSGTVTDANGRAQAGVIVYAYQTDHQGRYPTSARLQGAAARHGRLRAWARTDGTGRYRFDTIRPGAYPGRPDPAHIHMHVIEPGRCTYYLGELMFADDPKLTAAIRERETRAHGGYGVTRLRGDAQRGWQATRDIRLGLNVEGYADCSRRAAPAVATL